MDRNYMERTVLPRIRVANDRMEAARDGATQPTIIKLNKYKEVVKLLHEAWTKGLVYSEVDIARACPLLGHHETFEVRVPEAKRVDSSKRMVRHIIERLRKVYGYPILSTPGLKGKRGKVLPPAGYWFARSQQEVDEYFLRTGREIKEMISSRVETFDALRGVFCHLEDRFRPVREALTEIIEPADPQGNA